MSYIIKTNQLTKAFKGKEVVSNVNMKVKKGEIYGFLGPNGAGKTTIMKMLTNLVKPTSGEIEIFGEKLTNTSYEVLKRMGSIIEYPVFYDRLTARENLELHCEYMGYYDKKAINAALDLVKLKNIEDKSVKDFSLGMKQRLGIARAIITKPELLILDEPINGLDPVGIKELRELFHMLCREYGITMLISSHILGEMEQIADTIGVISDGKLIKEVSMDEIQEQNREYIELAVNDVKKAFYVLDEILHLTNFKVVDGSRFRIYDTGASQSEISKTLILNGVMIEEINKKNHSLEDYFLTLINGGGISA
ncbi:ABC transporter ATP-binding protein [Neobacillus vireti]|uniref:Bacitracin ABC transporter, ATP-binding protein n=1 Tax=Neobacillus vireti LMG 21834 TaxID=1131730 RepID=A0AB94IV15_9BACI|nr:ABC transporter ATP-binding protein [Neobacillus vireti]ETI70901.1 bacitracin ABC transporter, ATP-binding protein [Neobacillus vireti LMG 21834]KLT17568.1 bacitracin ABC transporter ATP-binding protein [Neobacillus vireti]